jgi:DNA-binding phage protein
MLDDNDVIRLLRSEIERAGGQSALARREHIDRTLLNRVLCGRKRPTKEIIRALKLCNAYTLHGHLRAVTHRRAGRLSSHPFCGGGGLDADF